MRQKFVSGCGCALRQVGGGVTPSHSALIPALAHRYVNRAQSYNSTRYLTCGHIRVVPTRGRFALMAAQRRFRITVAMVVACSLVPLAYSAWAG